MSRPWDARALASAHRRATAVALGLVPREMPKAKTEGKYVWTLSRADRAAYQRELGYRWLRGEAHGLVHGGKLTDAKVREMRELRERGMTQEDLARRFGVSRGLVGHIVRREIWTHA